MSTTAVLARGLTHARGSFRLGPVDVELPTGLVMGFVGHNGAGKTTTIRSLLGMLPTAPGQVRLFDELEPGSAQARARTGVVLDRPFLAPQWRVGGLGRRLGRFHRTWNQSTFERLQNRFGLDPAARCGTLSRGQGAKLALALALSHEPELLVLDEPTSGLDPLARQDVVDVLREFMVDERHSILFSTHITSDLDHLADLILVMDSGRLAYSGSLHGLGEEFAMVRGTGELTEEAGRHVHGLRRNPHGFEGLIRTEATPAFDSSVVIEAAGTDDVVIHLARNTSPRAEQKL